MPSTERLAFLGDLRAAEEATRAGITRDSADRASKTWARWVEFCHSLNHDPHLTSVSDPVILLQAFAHRVRDGRSSQSHNPVGAGTVSDALRHVGQTIAHMGSPDPRLNPTGTIDLRLRRQLSSYTKSDPPPRRVQPVPLPVLHHVLDSVYSDSTSSPGLRATADLIAVAYFFLMRPGEFCSGSSDSHPFHTVDVSFFRHDTKLDPWTCPAAALNDATHVSLVFTKQKNCVRGERVSQSISGHHLLCPVRALARRFLHLRQHHSPRDVPIHTYHPEMRGARQLQVHSTSVTTLLRRSITLLGDHNLAANEFSARCLRATGATSLLLAGIDSNLIRLLGRWQSDAMLRYLHVQTAPIRHRLAEAMIAPQTRPPASFPVAGVPLIR